MISKTTCQWIFTSFLALSNLIAFAGSNNPVSMSSPKEPIILEVTEKPFKLDGKGKAVPMFDLTFITPDGKRHKNGYFGTKGEWFDVIVQNRSTEPTSLHWHGLIVPNDQDGVPDVTQKLIPPGKSMHYKFKLLQSGTYWLHSHQGLQEQRQLAAPLIIYDNNENKANPQQVVMFLEDFTYQDPKKILKNLQSKKMTMPKISQQKDAKSDDINDIKYDAFLTNKKTLKSPQVIEVSPGQKIKLRVISGTASTNFLMKLGKLNGKVVAVDGEPILPLTGNNFPIGIGNRLDIIVTIPKEEGNFPILAQAEGTRMQTGLILKTPKATLNKVKTLASKPIGRLHYYPFEEKLQGTNTLTPKKISKSLEFVLTGTMNGYIWKINNQAWPNITPMVVEKGQRIELVFKNNNSMAHPMHFHGHVFQVTELNGKPLKQGARRDTILVQPNTTVKIVFDADNPGVWVAHCHNLYHLNAGMLTTIEFKAYPKPDFYLKKIGAKPK